MTIIPHLLQTESPTDELALFLVGEKKAGKSYIAATAPGNILFLDFDQRLNALRTHPNVKNIYGLTFADPTSTTAPPTAFTDLLNVLNQIEKSPLLHNFFPGMGAGIPIDTIVLDSVQTISDSARAFVLFNAGSNDGISRNFSIGGQVIRVPKSYTAWSSEMEMVSHAILQARAFLHCKHFACWESVTYDKGKLWHTDRTKKYDHEPEPRAMNVIVTLHEAPEEDPRSTDTNPIYTGKITVYPVRYHKLLVYFNEVWRVTRESGRVPKIQCDPDGRFVQAATALGIPNIAVPDIAQVLSQVRSVRRLSQLQPTPVHPQQTTKPITPTMTQQVPTQTQPTKVNGDTKNAKS